MIFVTGPLYSGKKDYVKKRMCWNDIQLKENAIWDIQNLVKEDVDLEKLADKLSKYEVVIATEIGGGIVPTDASERSKREMAGRLSCIMAQRADEVIRVFCGLPINLK